MAHRIGEQLGKYRLVRLLGRGSFAEVYLGEHVHLKTEAAVKVLRAQLSANDAEDFLKEAQTIARLVHPHIVRIFDFDVQEGTPFLVMDYAPNGTLRQRHPKGVPVPLNTVVYYIKQVAEALQYAHDQKLVHRDVKPENMLIGRRKEILLSDFGTVQVAQSTHMEGEGTQKIAGTVAYMSPEQLQGRARTASDQYALGIVVYEWLSGERPFQGAFYEMASQHMFTSPMSLHEKVPTIPPAIEEVVLTALAKDPKQRFASVQDFATALEQACLPNASLPSTSTYTPPSAMLPMSPSAPTIVKQPSQPQQPLPPVSNPSLPAVAPIFTDPPAPIQQPLPPAGQPIPSVYHPTGTGPGRLQQQQRWKVRRNILLVVLAILIIASTATTVVLSIKPPTRHPPPPGVGIGASFAPDGEYIGLSDGTFTFDTNRPDGALKLQATDKLKHHDISSAVLLWQQAIVQDTNDAEALIYLEDQRVLASRHPYITLVVGIVLTGNSARFGRDNLQGAYVAQKEYNDGLKLPGGVLVRLLIANTGSLDKLNTNTLVAKQIVQAAQVDKTIVGVMGWLFSGTSRDVIRVLGAAHIPIVSPTAFFDFLTGISPYFFRVPPSNQRQVVVGVQYAEQKLHATRAALFVDPTDLYSKEIATDFEQRFVSDGNTIVVTKDYTVGQSEKLSGLLQDALTHNPDLIYFAGYATDVPTLLNDLPTSGPFAHLQVVGPDELFGNYPNVHDKFNRLHFTSLINSNTWNFLGLSAKGPAFFAEYAQDFDPYKRHINDPIGYSRANGAAIFSYDAMLALLAGSEFGLSGGKKMFSPSDLQQGLTRIRGSEAIQGVSGQISFGPDGNVVNKAVILLKLNPSGDAVIDSVQGTFLLGS